MMELYQAYPDKKNFFNKSPSKEINDINKFAGTRKFKEQIIVGKTVEEIRESWESELRKYKNRRKKYLLYK